MARAAGLVDFHSYAQEVIDTEFRSGLFDVPVLLSILSRKGTTEGKMGRPGSAFVIGKNITGTKMRTLAGSTLRHVFFQTERVGGGATLTSDGNTSSAGTSRSDSKKRSAYIHWFYREFPIAIRNMTLRQARGRYALGSAIADATVMATEELMEDLATRVYTGNPSNQSTDEPWDNLMGLQQWIHTTNTIGGIDRSSVTGFDGVRVTTAKAATLALLDEAMLNHDGSGNGLADKGSRADVWITGNILYNKFKQEALSRGAQLVTNDVPKGGQVGFIGEYVNYNGKMITLDPFCPASTVFGLDSRTWEMELDPKENFRVLPFKDLREELPGTGQADLTTSAVAFGGRLICTQPWKNIQYTNVS